MDDSNLFIKVEEHVLTCTICGERFNNPKTLKCDHTFCAECIEKHHKENSEGNQAPCPLCREPFIFCHAGSSYLRPSLSIVKLLDLLQRSERNGSNLAEHACQISYHCNGSGATSFCPRCNKYMCDKCAEAHSHLLKDHEVNPLKPFQNFDSTENFECPQHNSEVPYLRCISCDAIMCGVCKSEHDETHIIKSVEQMKSEIREIRKSVISIKDRYENEQYQYKLADNIISTSEKNSSQQLSTSYKKVKQILDENKTQLDLDIKKHSEELHNAVDERSKIIESQLNTASRLIDFIDRLFSSGRERCLLEYWPDIQNNLKEIPDYESNEHNKATPKNYLNKSGIEFKPCEGLLLGRVTKSKAYEDFFGNFKQKDGATKCSTKPVKKETSHPKDHMTTGDHVDHGTLDTPIYSKANAFPPENECMPSSNGRMVVVDSEAGTRCQSCMHGIDVQNREQEHYSIRILEMSAIVDGSKKEVLSDRDKSKPVREVFPHEYMPSTNRCLDAVDSKAGKLYQSCMHGIDVQNREHDGSKTEAENGYRVLFDGEESKPVREDHVDHGALDTPIYSNAEVFPPEDECMLSTNGCLDAVDSKAGKLCQSCMHEIDVQNREHDENVVKKMHLEGSTLSQLNAAITGAAVYRNTMLFLASYKKDKIYVIDIEKGQRTGEKETVNPFDVAAARDGELLLVTCHKGWRKGCRIEKYRDGKLDGIFTRNVSFPCGITIMNDNDVCVCESNPEKKFSQLKIFDIKGNLKKEIQRSIFKCPSYLTATPENELLVADIDANCVWCLKKCEIGYTTIVCGESEIVPRKAILFNNTIFVTGKRTGNSRVFDRQGQQIYEVRIKNEEGFFNPALLVDSGRSLVCISETGTVINVLPQQYESMFITKL